MCLVCLLWPRAYLGAADAPLAELQKVSGLGQVDAAALRRGEIVSQRGVQGNFARGVYAESCYYIKAPVAKVGGTLLHWDPSTRKETEVSVYRSYQWPAPPDIFDGFRLSASQSNDRWLIDATLDAVRGDAGSLHLRPADLEILRKVLPKGSSAASGGISLGWQQILQQQNAAMARGGLANVPSYTAGGTAIKAADEFQGVLKMTPRISSHFSSLTGARPLFADGRTTVDEAVPYAEQSQVNGHTSLCLGVSSAVKGPETWQVLDCTYYTADTYFLSIALYQLWPWEEGTLVWQVDYTSAPFRAYLGGIDRAMAGKEMSKSSAGAARTLRRVIEGADH